MSAGNEPPRLAPWPPGDEPFTTARPPDPPAHWLPLIGEYGPEREPVYVFEEAGDLRLQEGRGPVTRLRERTADHFVDGAGGLVRFVRDDGAGVTSLIQGALTWARRHVGPADGSDQMQVTPVGHVEVILDAARRATPPAESGEFRHSDLVDVESLDPGVRLDVRYATPNNFLSTPFYEQARAFLQRPAAEAVVRVHRALAARGYGVVLFDGYRPWYVTRAFWDATPPAQRWMVADPASGSRHNRGAAVDLTLCELASGRAVEMPSGYDEPTPRAYAFYPGGTTLQRWHRALLRREMEAEGFTLNPSEWWHFDYRDWRAYRIGNAPISSLR